MRGAPPTAGEAERLWRYLFGGAPSPAAVDAYVSELGRQHVGSPADRFDVFLLRWALLGRVTARAADLYARFARPNAWLRRKLILLMALGESDGPGARVFHAPVVGGLGAFVIVAALRGTLSLLATALCLPVLAVAHATGRRPLG